MAWKLDIDFVSAQPSFEIDKDSAGEAPWGFGWGCGALHSRIGCPVPTSATQTDSKPLVDVFPLPGFACVSERFRAIVESFEPGVHEFFPIQLKSRKRVAYAEPYFLINVRQRFDCILIKGIEFEWGSMVALGLEGMPYMSWMGKRPPMSASKTTIAGRHLWRTRWVPQSRKIMVSDQLRAALIDAKIRRLTFKEPWAQHFAEVDTPFDYREQVPGIVDWIEANRPAVLLEEHLDWVKAHMPHWLS